MIPEGRQKLMVKSLRDPESRVDLESTLQHHFFGNRNNPSISKKIPKIIDDDISFKYKLKNPPPLPETSSSSAVYAKKIELFKQKLRSLKGASGGSRSPTLENSRPVIRRVVPISQKETPEDQTNGKSIFLDSKSVPKAFKNSRQRSKHSRSNIQLHSILTNENDQLRSVDTEKTSNSYNNSIFQENISDSQFFNSITPVDKFYMDSSTPKSPFFNFDTESVDSLNTSRNHAIFKKRAQIKERKCVICGINLDSFYNIQNSERVIELSCGHMSHEECILMELELNVSTASIPVLDFEMFHDQFPRCDYHQDTQKAVPKNDSILFELFTKIISLNIDNSLHMKDTDLHKNNSGLSLESGKTSTHFSDVSKMVDATELTSSSEYIVDRTNTPDTFDSLQKPYGALHDLDGDKNHPFSREEIHTIKKPTAGNRNVNKSNKLSPYKVHAKKPSRGSHVSGTQAIVSSVNNNSSTNLSLNWAMMFSKELLTKKFIGELCGLSEQQTIKASDESEMKLSEDLLCSFGELRLVDKIEVATNFSKEKLPSDHYCYLFTHLLLILHCDHMTFSLINISFSTYIDSSLNGCLILKSSKNSKDFHKLVFSDDLLKEKWKAALTNMKMEFDRERMTSNLKIDEFDRLLKFDDHIDSKNNGVYIGSDGYRRLQTGVNPRFYDNTIKSLIFRDKPERVLIILNQTKIIADSVIAVKNIIRSLSMIGIDILLILCSTSTLTIDSYEIDSYELKKQDFKNKGDAFLDKLDDFQNYLNGEPSNIGTKDKMVLSDLIEQYTTGDDTVTITLSNSSLSKFHDIPSTNNILIEVGLDSFNRNKRGDVSDLAEWDDAMEVICSACGLEFDESDFYSDFEDSDDITSDEGKSIKGLFGKADLRNTNDVSIVSEDTLANQTLHGYGIDRSIVPETSSIYSCSESESINHVQIGLESNHSSPTSPLVLMDNLFDDINRALEQL